MFVALVAIALLIASVGAIYFILKSMGQDGVEIAAPGSCKSGTCGVRKVAGGEGGCHQDQSWFSEAGAIDEQATLYSEGALAQPPGSRPGRALIAPSDDSTPAASARRRRVASDRRKFWRAPTFPEGRYGPR